MKAVVLEIREKKAAVLSQAGIVSVVPDKQYSIGEEIDMKENKKFRFGKNWTTAVAGMAAALLIFAGGGVIAYSTPVSYVTMDVNPSIEYTLNFLDDVIEANALNEEAEEVVTKVDWKSGDINDVIAETLAVLEELDYLDPDNWDDNAMIIGITAKNEDREARLIEGLRTELQSIIFEDDDDSDTDDEELGENIQVIGIGAERVQRAEQLSEEFGYNVTPGKLNLVEKLDASITGADGDSLTDEEIEEWLDRPVRDIMKEIKANKEAVKAENGLDDLDDDAITEEEELGKGNAYGKDKNGQDDDDDDDDDDDEDDDDDDDDDDEDDDDEEDND